MKQYLVFLDIDGVFTSARVHCAHNASFDMWHQFDPIAIQFFNKIHDTYNVKFVLISTWKNHIDVDNNQTSHWIKSAFANSGFRGEFATLWKTDPHESWVNQPRGYNRAHEIRDYLDARHEDCDDYIIFDDNDYNFEGILGKKRLIRTDHENGLLYKHMKNAMSIMGVWEKKK